MSKKEELEGVLKQLQNVGDVEGCAIVTRDGLLVAQIMPDTTDPETFAAMTATMVGAAETAVSELKKGGLLRIIAESEQSKIIATGSGEQSITVVMVKSDGNVGLVLLELKKSAQKIADIMTS